jgi:hypothetical protein
MTQQIFTLKNEYDLNEMSLILKNNNRLIILGMYAGVGKTSAFKNVFMEQKAHCLIICPSNRLCYDNLSNGFNSFTCHRLLRMGINSEHMKEMKGVDLTDVKYLLWDEIMCYNLKIRQKIEYFMRKNPSIKYYATADVKQLPAPKVEEKEFEYLGRKLPESFPNSVYLKEIKRCKDKDDVLLIHKLKDMIFDYNFEWTNDRKREILKDFPTVSLNEITTDKTICYLHNTEKQINTRINALHGGMKIGDKIVCKDKLIKKKDNVICHVNTEYEIVERYPERLIIEDKLQKSIFMNKVRLGQDVSTESPYFFEITRAEFSRNFRLCYAMCNHSCQGLSLDGEGVIADLLFKFATREWTYVALTRFREMKKLKLCWNDYATLGGDKLIIKNLEQKILGHKKEDREKGRVFSEYLFVNHKWVICQLEKQMYRCYNDACSVNLELDYEDGSRNQYSIDRIDNERSHEQDNCRLLCLNCQNTLKEFSFKLDY